MENVPAIATRPSRPTRPPIHSDALGRQPHRAGFTTSLARDGNGRTRSEQDVAMLGPLVVLQKGMNWYARFARAAAAHE